MVWNKHGTNRNADGFTLLEVLISIFILGTGILSVFSLFMAGRSLQAYYHRHNAARIYASSTALELSDNWVKPETVKLWVNSTGDAQPFVPSSPSTNFIDSHFAPYTYLIDPVGLNSNASGGRANTTQWNVAFTQTETAAAVARIGLSPLTDAETAINKSASMDDLGYELSDPTSPDTSFLVRSFYGGRQRRNQQYVHALLITPDTNAILVFKDRVVPTAAFDAIPEGWPVGSCRLRQTVPSAVVGTVTAIENATLVNHAGLDEVNTCLRPKQWAVIRGLADNSFRFARVMAVIKDDEISDETYTLVFAENLEGDVQFGNIDTSSGVECYFYSSLIHVAPYTEP